MKKKLIFHRVIIVGAGLLITGLIWLLTTNNVNIWPVRNTLQYHLLTWWWDRAGYPVPGDPGTLQGTIKNPQATPIAYGWVVASAWDGTTYSAHSDATGRYTINSIPAGSYRPAASAPGYQALEVQNGWRNIHIEAGETTTSNIVLPPETPREVTPGQNLKFTRPVTFTCTIPLTTTALQYQVTFDSGGQPNQPTFLYTPITATANSRLPLLLAVYPGPADTWQCASIPLAAAGYAVLAVGPSYTFELENDIDELQRLVAFARAGQFPNADGHNMALLGGSYSSIHVQRLLQRDQNFAAALLLGPPTDLFDMRRRLEAGAYIPPFGLDQALIALGLPNREPLRYFRYSGAYHVRPNFPPMAILHSRSDDVVPYQQSELLHENLKLVGAPHETHFFDGASHYLLAEEGDKDSLKIYEITLDFLAAHLE
jgi:dipeptidyl aminopeptidase/acylaminoacyl peptidase